MGFLITKIKQILKRFSRAFKVEREPLISEEHSGQENECI